MNNQFIIPSLISEWTPWPEQIDDFFIKAEPVFSLEDEKRITRAKQDKQFKLYSLKTEREDDSDLPLYLQRPFPELIDPRTNKYRCRKFDCKKTFKTLHTRGRHEMTCKFFRTCNHCRYKFKNRSHLLKHKPYCSKQYGRITASYTSMG